MNFLRLLLAVSLAEVAFVLILCLAMMLLLVWRWRRARAAGRPALSWSQTSSWRQRVSYLARLISFGILSLVLVSFSLMVYQNLMAARHHLAPAPSRVTQPANFPYFLEPIVFQSTDGLRLHGWLIEPDQPAVVVLLHGYGSNRSSMLWHAEKLAEAGFGVLMYDARASGMSEGRRRSYGWQDPADVTSALNYLQRQPTTASSSVGIAGCSIGGQIALQAAASDDRILSVWSDGPSVVRTADLPAPHNWVSALGWFSSHLTDWMFALHLRMTPPPALIEQLPQIAPRPVQLVAGGTPANLLGAESRLVAKYHRAAGEGAELWVIEQAVHCDGPGVVPQKYARRMVRFFQQNLLD